MSTCWTSSTPRAPSTQEDDILDHEVAMGSSTDGSHHNEGSDIVSGTDQGPFAFSDVARLELWAGPGAMAGGGPISSRTTYAAH